MFKRSVYGTVALIMLGGIVVSLFIPVKAKADISSCQASMHAHAVSADSDNQFAITITNTDPNTIQWVSITRPSDNFTINSTDSPGWTDSSTTSVASETQGGLGPGDNMDVNIDIQSANVDADPANWLVQVSDSPDGLDPLSCSGDLSMAIVGPLANSPPAIISRVAASSIGPTFATITWSTDEATTSELDYGLDTNYGSVKTDSTMQTEHSTMLNNLTPNTAYHYQILATDTDSNVTDSGDNTFVTAIVQPPQTITKTVTVPGLSIVVTNPADKTPPTIILNTKVAQVVKSIPTISGLATDDSAVVRVEYSTDGGHNWLPVDSAPDLGGKQVSFSFSPSNLDDGNYQISARAIDPGGNVTSTAPISVVVDRLPPLVGGSVTSLGPEVLQSDSSGTITTLAAVDQKITLSAVGGATGITLVSQSSGSAKSQSFSLVQSPDNGLWSGVMSFSNPGIYKITANAVDGAGNKTSRLLDSVNVLAPGRLVMAGTDKPAPSTVTVYYQDSQSGDWLVWDGSTYGQTNPQTTDKNGNFSLFLPAGKYYLKAVGKDGGRLTSDIFTLDKSTPLSAVLTLKSGGFRWPWADFATQPMNLNLSAAKSTKNPLIGQVLPGFSLTDTNGKQVESVDLLGKPTDVVLGATWAPTMAEQVPALSQLQTDKDINIEPVALQQNAAQAQAYDQIAGYSLVWLADPDSTLSTGLDAGSLPTHYFVDRTGIVRAVVSGVLTKQQILDELTDL